MYTSKKFMIETLISNIIRYFASFGSQMELTIPAVSQDSSVLCYVQRKGEHTAEVIQAAEVTAGHVTCKPHIAQRASRMEWGAAYTWDAAIDG
jgi:hypothetical protein